MKKRYFVWKDANCNGINPEWVELTGKEFYEFLKSPDNRNRHFSTLGDPELDDECYVMECTFTEYQKNHKENCARYRRKGWKLNSGISEVSFSSQVSDTTTLTYEDVIPDEDVSVEEIVLRGIEIEALGKAIETLNEKEKVVILTLFINNKTNISEREIARKMCIPQKTLNCQKKAAIKKLQEFFAQN